MKKLFPAPSLETRFIAAAKAGDIATLEKLGYQLDINTDQKRKTLDVELLQNEITSLSLPMLKWLLWYYVSDLEQLITPAVLIKFANLKGDKSDQLRTLLGMFSLEQQRELIEDVQKLVDERYQAISEGQCAQTGGMCQLPIAFNGSEQELDALLHLVAQLKSIETSHMEKPLLFFLNYQLAHQPPSSAKFQAIQELLVIVGEESVNDKLTYVERREPSDADKEMINYLKTKTDASLLRVAPTAPAVTLVDRWKLTLQIIHDYIKKYNLLSFESKVLNMQGDDKLAMLGNLLIELVEAIRESHELEMKDYVRDMLSRTLYPLASSQLPLEGVFEAARAKP